MEIRTDVLILPIKYLDDLNFTRNEEITQNYQVSHEAKSSTNGKKGFLLYHFRRREVRNDAEPETRPIESEQQQEESKSAEAEQREQQPKSLHWELTISIGDTIQFQL